MIFVPHMRFSLISDKAIYRIWFSLCTMTKISFLIGFNSSFSARTVKTINVSIMQQPLGIEYKLNISNFRAR